MAKADQQHKDQHWIPQSYLKAWCDPDVPAGQSPFVWMFSKNGESSKSKAPKNIFSEKDLYTIHLPDGTRDLTIEHGLAGLESDFVAIRDGALARHEPLDERSD